MLCSDKQPIGRILLDEKSESGKKEQIIIDDKKKELFLLLFLKIIIKELQKLLASCNFRE